MKGFRDWVFGQLLSKSLASSSRPLSGSGSFFHRDELDSGDPSGVGCSRCMVELECSRRGTASSCNNSSWNLVNSSSYGDVDMTNQEESSEAFVSSLVSTNGYRSDDTSTHLDTSCSSNQEVGDHLSLQPVVIDAYQTNPNINGKKDPLAKMEDVQINFFRLLRRFGQPHDSLLVAKVLYRLHLASLIRAGESDLKKVNYDRARAIAAEQEASGIPELDFSVRILVLGKTGVGKSATINSVFDQAKTVTDAFRPATDCIKEVSGTVDGVKVTFIDTPGFLPSSTCNVRKNRKIMLSVRRFIKKSPPDVVLFFERLDLINMGYSDFSLLKLMTKVFGNAIWFNTVLVMTHAATIPEGPSGYPVSYELYVTQCTNLMQHCINQALSDSKLENPVLLVENHPQCRKNFMGETILPNGEVWKSQFLLLCICTKVLGDANTLLAFRDSMELGPAVSPRVPSLPHLLSSLLRHRSASRTSEADDTDFHFISDAAVDKDEYDQLPPIRILTKSQFERLTKSQKRAYLDELDYRETLYLKKQLKEETQRRREKSHSVEEHFREDSNSSDQQDSPEAFLLPDMVVPLSFDSDWPVHRYRCLVTSDQWLVRPVLDPQGWDHDVGFDGINLDTAIEVKRNVYASIVGQMSKDKQDFSTQSECAAAYTDLRGLRYIVGLEAQSAGKDLIYTVRSNTRLSNVKPNVIDCGVSLTSFGNKYYVGAKLEDTLLVGKRLKLVMNAGQMRGHGQVAYGGSFDAVLRGGDYPVRNDSVGLSMTALSFNKEIVLGGGFQSEFRPIRGMKLEVNANLNSRKMGQVNIKMSSSEHIEIALIAVFSIFKALCRRKVSENRTISGEGMEVG